MGWLFATMIRGVRNVGECGEDRMEEGILAVRGGGKVINTHVQVEVQLCVCRQNYCDVINAIIRNKV